MEFKMSFRITGLDPAQFSHLYGMSEEELAKHGARRKVLTEGVPDRVELREVRAGESAILLNYVHQPADTPYRSSYAIFVREGAVESCDTVDVIPDLLKTRLISLRAFSHDHNLAVADVVEGVGLPPLIEKFLSDPAVAYLHAHYAGPGCYAAKIERA
jgi:hypothetical protein